MFELLYKLIIGHNHRYETVNAGKVYSGSVIISNFYDCRCEICGKMKQFRL